MPADFVWIWSLDGWIVLAGILCAVAAALPGCFLVLRKMSLLGDAISHAVLPGLAVAFFLSESRSSLPMFLGAVVVGILTAMLTEWIRGVGKVDEGASMGVVFTSLFALGLVLISRAAEHVDLDASCVLYGAIESVPLDVVMLGGVEVPRAVITLSVVCLVNALFILVFFKELRITSFDADLATSSGINARLMHYLLMVIVAVTSVACFESVGNILVVAMFVVPPATAFMLTQRLSAMIAIAVVCAALSAVLGHLGAIAIPGWFGMKSTTTSGMMAVAAGCLFMLAMLFSPGQGVISRMVHQWNLSLRILADDVLALLYRSDERDRQEPLGIEALRKHLFAGTWALRAVLWRLRHRGLVVTKGAIPKLSEAGRDRARDLVRSHRLWEEYLHRQAGLDPERLHDKAERLEHFTDVGMRDQLHEETEAAERDPHGKPIPPERGPRE